MLALPMLIVKPPAAAVLAGGRRLPWLLSTLSLPYPSPRIQGVAHTLGPAAEKGTLETPPVS